MEEMSRSFGNISLSDVDPPPLLHQRSDFHFLLQQTTDWVHKVLFFKNSLYTLSKNSRTQKHDKKIDVASGYTFHFGFAF